MPQPPQPDVTPVPNHRSQTVIDAIESRRSIRQFTSQAVPVDVLRRILQVSSRAASGGNIQPWKVYVAWLHLFSVVLNSRPHRPQCLILYLQLRRFWNCKRPSVQRCHG